MRQPRLWAAGALVLASALTVQAAGDPSAVTEGKKLISANAEQICLFAHAHSSYGYKDHEYVGAKKTKDGYHALTFRFTVKGNLKTQTMDMEFYFKDNGEFQFLRVPAYTTIYKPFESVSKSYLKQLRDQMSKRPAVAGSTELLRVVDTASAQELCEMHLKYVQAGKR